MTINFTFKITKKSKNTNARTGVISTKHGSIKTPCFMPDATRASIRGLTADDLRRVGLQSMVVNTYHLYLQPGIKKVKKAKGVHEFMNWQGPLTSDSGGYQVFSLVHRNQSSVIAREPRRSEAESGDRSNPVDIDDSGVSFRSPYDGSKHKLTPKKSIQIQFDLGTDLMICFDDVPPHDIGKKGMEKSIEHTIDWAKECKKEFESQVKKRKLQKQRPILFGVIQGGIDKSLRKRCAEALLEIGFDGYGFGARPVDKDGNFLADVLDYTARLIPDDKVRFNLGMGTPNDIVRAVKMGWDLFDCVIPTREARHGRLWGHGERTNEHVLSSRAKRPNVLIGERSRGISFNIFNSKFSTDFTAINALSKLPELKTYTKAYLHHLFKTQEPLSIRLATLNNLEFYMDLMKDIRKGISSGKL